MKNSADLGGCYPPRPSASVDNTLLDLQNSSYPTQPHSIIANYSPKWSWIVAGAIVGDGDRKSWNARGPMIWDNFIIFRTNCAILTSYICAAPRTCRGFSRGCCHVAWSKIGESCEFSQRWQGIRQGRRTMALLWTFMLWVNGKDEFFRVGNFFNFAIWMNNICSRRLL